MLLPFGSFAQEKAWTVGIKAIPEISHLAPINDNGLPTLGGGIQIAYPLNNSFSLESGIYYQNRGTEGTLQLDSYSSGKKLKFLFRYLSLPVLLRYKIGQKWYILAGPAIDYYLLTKVVYGDGETYKSRDSNGNRLGLGGIAAFGYEAPLPILKEINFFIEARINPVLNNEISQIAALNYGLGAGFNYRF